MTINTYNEGSSLVIELSGRLDTSTAPAAENELNKACANDSIILELKNLDYVSSAGLRVILLAQKTMNSKEGNMVVRHCNDDIYEIFEMTGFTEVITIER